MERKMRERERGRRRGEGAGSGRAGEERRGEREIDSAGGRVGGLGRGGVRLPARRRAEEDVLVRVVERVEHLRRRFYNQIL